MSRVSTLNHPVFLISHGDFSNLNDTYGYERGTWTIFSKRDFLHLSATATELCGEWFGFCFCRFWCSSRVTVKKIDSLKKIWWQQQKSTLLAQKATKRLLQCPDFQSTIYSALHHLTPGIHRKILVQ